MVLTFAQIVVVALQTCIALQSYGSYSPYSLLRSTHGRITTGNELANDGTYFHRGGFIVLLRKHLKMSSVNTTTLLQKIAYGDRPFVIDNTGWFIEQLIAQLRNESLDRDFINRTIGGNTCNDIAEGDHFTQFGVSASYPVMQTPEKVNRMSHKSSWIVNWYGTTSNHPNLGIFEWGTQILYSRVFWYHISTNKYDHWTDGLFKK